MAHTAVPVPPLPMPSLTLNESLPPLTPPPAYATLDGLPLPDVTTFLLPAATSSPPTPRPWTSWTTFMALICTHLGFILLGYALGTLQAYQGCDEAPTPTSAP